VSGLALQKAIRARLVGTPSVIALVPATAILDVSQRPAPDPSIILGESQVVEGDHLKRDVVTVFHTLHVWKREPSLTGINAIMAAVKAALQSSRLPLTDGHQIADCYVASYRAMRDPGGEFSHGVMTVEAVVA